MTDISSRSNMPMCFVAPNYKVVMTITPEGKIIVDPNAPADQTAKEVCEILSKMVVSRGELFQASKALLQLFEIFQAISGNEIFERFKAAVKSLETS